MKTRLAASGLVVGLLLLSREGWGQTPTLTLERTFDLQGQLGGMVAPSDGRYLYVSVKTNGRVLKLDLCSFECQTVTVPSQPGALALSPDESRLYVAKSGATSLAVVDTASWTLSTTWDLAGHVPYAIAASDNRVYIAADEGFDAVLVIVNPQDGSIVLVHEDGWDSNTRLLALDRARSKLYSGVMGSSPSNLSRWNVATEPPILETECAHGDLGSYGKNLTLSPDGLHLLFIVGGGNGDGHTVYNLQALSENFQSRDGEYYFGTDPQDMVYHPLENQVYGVGVDYSGSAIAILDTETQVQTGALQPSYVNREEPVKLCLTGNGSGLFLYAENTWGHLYLFALEEICPSPTPVMIRSESGDYNGDGSSDIGLFRPPTSGWSVRNVTRLFFGSSADSLVAGDYDGDGTSEAAVFRPATGLWSAHRLTRFFLGAASDVTIPGDYDGDGKTDAAIFRPDRKLWVLRNISRLYFGSSEDFPVPGDYDGNGTKEIAVFRSTSSLWAVPGLTRFYFGSRQDLPRPGDFDGNGTWEAAVVRPSALGGAWMARGLTRLLCGLRTDQPVPADYDGDGGDEAGIFRPKTGFWWAYDVTMLYYGAQGDMPVTR
jgi:hypothetical protein